MRRINARIACAEDGHTTRLRCNPCVEALRNNRIANNRDRVDLQRLLQGLICRAFFNRAPVERGAQYEIRARSSNIGKPARNIREERPLPTRKTPRRRSTHAARHHNRRVNLNFRCDRGHRVAPRIFRAGPTRNRSEPVLVPRAHVRREWLAELPIHVHPAALRSRETAGTCKRFIDGGQHEFGGNFAGWTRQVDRPTRSTGKKLRLRYRLIRAAITQFWRTIRRKDQEWRARHACFDHGRKHVRHRGATRHHVHRGKSRGLRDAKRHERTTAFIVCDMRVYRRMSRERHRERRAA